MGRRGCRGCEGGGLVTRLCEDVWVVGAQTGCGRLRCALGEWLVSGPEGRRDRTLAPSFYRGLLYVSTARREGDFPWWVGLSPTLDDQLVGR